MSDCLLRMRSDVMFKINNMSEFRVLMFMASECDVACGKCMADKIVVNGIFLDEAERELSLGRQTLRNCVCSLNKKGLIFRDERCRGVYYLNPYVLIKGMRSDITDIVKYLQDIGIDI